MITPQPTRFGVAQRAAQKASELGLTLWSAHRRLDIKQKADQDFVSDADRTMEELIRSEILSHFPTDSIAGEELGGQPTQAFWSVDPIDGTANFLRGSPLWGLSIAYVVDGVTEVGVITLPALRLALSAEKDGALFCNNNEEPARSETGIRIVAVGDNVYWPDGNLGLLEGRLRDHGWGVASYRCATVGLAFAALGYTDGYLEKWTNLWDIAAGRLLCEKGGLEIRSGEELSEDAASTWVQAATPEVLAAVDDLWATL